MMSILISFVIILSYLFLTPSAHAHYVWLEHDGDGPAYAYFGEWIDDIREKTGDMLDRIKAPRATLAGSTQLLPVKRNADSLEIAVKGASDLRLEDDSLAPQPDKQKGGATKTVYYARAGRSESTAKLALEIVPVKAGSNTFTVTFSGVPLAKAEVTVAGPPKWEKRQTADEQGRITVPTPWAGRYVLEVIHFDEKPGGGGSEKLNRTRHISSLSFVQHEGIPWSDLNGHFKTGH